jgi:hypothetical protein
MVSYDLICIRRCLLRSGSFCRALHPHRQDRSGIPVVTSTLRPMAEASSSSSSATSPDQDSTDDYPEIGISAYGDSVREGRLIFMVAPNGDSSHNNSSRDSTIRRWESPDARKPNAVMIWNSMPCASRRLWR